MTAEELQRLASVTDNVEFAPRIVRMARELIAARRVVEAIKSAEEVSVHTGYDNAPGGGNFVYSDAILMDDIRPALSAYEEAKG